MLLYWCVVISFLFIYLKKRYLNELEEWFAAVFFRENNLYNEIFNEIKISITKLQSIVKGLRYKFI
jgi:hypothetical protein